MGKAARAANAALKSLIKGSSVERLAGEALAAESHDINQVARLGVAEHGPYMPTAPLMTADDIAKIAGTREAPRPIGRESVAKQIMTPAEQRQYTQSRWDARRAERTAREEANNVSSAYAEADAWVSGAAKRNPGEGSLGDVIPGKRRSEEQVRDIKTRWEARKLGRVPEGKTKPFDHIWDESAGSGWQKMLKTFGNAATGAGMSNKEIWNSSLTRAITPGVGGAVAGAVVGGLGGLMFPGNVEYTGVMGGAIKGAMMGAGLGIMGRGAGALTKKLGQEEFQHMQWLAKPAGMMSKIGESKAYSGAIAAATGYMGAMEINLTRPLNPQGY